MHTKCIFLLSLLQLVCLSECSRVERHSVGTNVFRGDSVLVKISFERVRAARRVYYKKCCGNYKKCTTVAPNNASSETTITQTVPTTTSSPTETITSTTTIAPTAMSETTVEATTTIPDTTTPDTTTSTSTTTEEPTTTTSTSTSSTSTSTTSTSTTTTTSTSTTSTTSTSTTSTTTTSTTTTSTTSTTTTTEKPLCVPYTCAVDNTMAIDSYGRPPAGANIGGLFRTLGSKNYMFSNDKKTWADASSTCCAMGMQLLSLETEVEYFSIADIVDGGALNGEYFTSGSDNKKEKNFVWCGANNISVAYFNWAPGMPTDTTGTVNCLSLSAQVGKKGQLSDRSCSTPMNYICESAISPNYECTADVSYLGSDDLVNMTSTLVDGDFRVACNKVYFFSRHTRNHLQSAYECCKRRMRMAIFESTDEQTCFTDMLGKPYGAGFAAWMWVAASKIPITGFVWQYPNSNGSISADTIRWNAGQPDNWGGHEDCLNVIIQGGTPPSNVVYNDLPCDNTLRYICERDLLEPLPFPQCPTIPCTTEPTKQAELTILLSSDGVFQSGCGRQYFISSVTKNRDQAMTECCKYGLQLLSIDSPQELQCIFDMNNNGAKKNGQYWTSGSNDPPSSPLGVNNYGWCTSKNLVNASLWAAGQPSSPFTLRCVAFQLSTASLGANTLQDLDCATNIPFICEALS